LRFCVYVCILHSHIAKNDLCSDIQWPLTTANTHVTPPTPPDTIAIAPLPSSSTWPSSHLAVDSPFVGWLPWWEAELFQWHCFLPRNTHVCSISHSRIPAYCLHTWRKIRLIENYEAKPSFLLNFRCGSIGSGIECCC
jgi:hypothetical protein